MPSVDPLETLQRLLEELLSSRVSIVEVARYVSGARFSLKQESNPLFLPFVGIDSETDGYPLGESRKQWSQEALERCDIERRQYETEHLSLARELATDLLNWIRAQQRKSS